MTIDISQKGIETGGTLIVNRKSLEHFPWPIEAESIEQVSCSNIIQCVKDLESFLAEIYRICKTSAIVRFMAPYCTSFKAYTDYRNVRQINEYSLVYFDNEFRKTNDLEYLPFSFKSVNLGFQWREPWDKKSDEKRDQDRMNLWNVVDDVMIETVVVRPPFKSDEQTGDAVI